MVSRHSKLKLVGVTGTNGKTTIATLLYKLFDCLGFKCGLISTVENIIDGKIIPSTHTTPDAVSLNELLKQMADEGCEYAFMEVSSHAVHQHRIAGLAICRRHCLATSRMITWTIIKPLMNT